MTAIFLLVALAALAAFIVTIGVVQHTTVSAAVQGARAYQAARTGIEWGIYQAISTSDCSAFPAGFNPPGLDAFLVNVTCADSSHEESGASFQVFRLTAVATTGAFGNPNFASRRIEVTVTNAP